MSHKNEVRWKKDKMTKAEYIVLVEKLNFTNENRDLNLVNSLCDPSLSLVVHFA